MGFIRDVKTDTLGKEATKAYERGDDFFTPLLNLPATQPDMTGNIQDWSAMVSAVTAAGWRLHTWSVARDKKDRLQAMPLFTR